MIVLGLEHSQLWDHTTSSTTTATETRSSPVLSTPSLVSLLESSSSLSWVTWRTSMISPLLAWSGLVLVWCSSPTLSSSSHCQLHSSGQPCSSSCSWSVTPLYSVSQLPLQILGVDSEFCNVEALVTGLVDNWPHLLRPHRKKFAVLVCVLSFCAGLPMCTQVSQIFTVDHDHDLQGGVYVFQLMDFYSASGMPLLWICFWETVALSWVFGAERFRDAIHEMTGHQPPFLFYLCWKYLGPAVMMGVFIFYLVSYSPVTYGEYNLQTDEVNVVSIVLLYHVHCRRVPVPGVGGDAGAGAVPGQHGLGPSLRSLLSLL